MIYNRSNLLFTKEEINIIFSSIKEIEIQNNYDKDINNKNDKDQYEKYEKSISYSNTIKMFTNHKN